MSHDLRKDAVGAIIEVTVIEDEEVVNVSTVTAKALVFKKPNQAATVTKTASFTTNGSDGKIRYITEAGFLDRAGVWKVQAYLQFPGGGYDGRGEEATFRVEPNL